MPLRPDSPAPYTSAIAVTSFLDRYRVAQLPDKFQPDDLIRIGVKESLVNRTMSSLRLLELIEEDGSPSVALARLTKSRPDEYKADFASHLRSVYSEVFTILDPASASAQEIQNAFWGYVPKGQMDAIIRLFLGLCAYAGLIAEEARPVVQATKPRKPERRSPVATPVRDRSGTGPRSGSASRQSTSSTTPAPPLPGLLFGFTENDVAALTQGEFDEVWTALGKVARARALRQSAAAVDEADDDAQEENDS
jgi:hypothetical protein